MPFSNSAPRALEMIERGLGPVITFLHGFSVDARMWAPQVSALEARYRTLAVTLPGFGVAGAGDVGERCSAAEVLSLLDALGIRKTHLVGLSMGGAVATDIALAAPERVASITLADALLLGRPAALPWRACAELAKAGAMDDARRLWLGDALFAEAAKNPALAAQVGQMVGDYAGGHWAGTLTMGWLEPAPASRLAELAMPALVIDGEHDTPSFRAMAAEYTGAIPRARRVTLEGVGHLSNLEAPAAFNAALSEHLGRVG